MACKEEKRVKRLAMIRINDIFEYHCRRCMKDCKSCNVQKELNRLGECKTNRCDSVKKPNEQLDTDKFFNIVDNAIREGKSLRECAALVTMHTSTLRYRIFKHKKLSFSEYRMVVMSGDKV